jgi:histidyl-tRNA synthetase
VAAQTDAIFVALDKLDKIGWAGVVAELTSRGVLEAVAVRLRALVERLSSASSTAELVDRAASCLASLPDGVLEGLSHTAAVLERLEAAEARCSFVVDPTVVRGMGYYTGQIFEIAHEGSDGSIAGGGRYDGLVGRSLGREVPACGISIGFDRIVDLAEARPVDLGVAVLYGDEPADEVLSVARLVRAAGTPAALVRRRKALHQQLDGLEAEGYSGFVLVAGGPVPEVRLFAHAGGEAGRG